MPRSLTKWLEEVNEELYIEHGFLFAEVSEWSWWIAFNNGASPQQAVKDFFLCNEQILNYADGTMQPLYDGDQSSM